MKKLLPLILLIFIATSCKSAKNTSQSSKRKTVRTTKIKTVSKPITKEANSIIREAKSYKGTKYKYGGITKRGIDCSGLIFNAFGENGISMPRTTKDLSKTGDWIDIKKVKEGDLVFFATKKNSRRVNHVGIVTAINPDDFTFIHSTTSSGVIESNITERYWYLAYVQARRYL